MTTKERRRSLRFKWLGVLILLVGLLAAAAIHLTVDDDADALAYEIVDGVAYPVLASESKAYRHDLERFGGKSALFADDLRRWLASLVHGKRLAVSVGVFAGLAAFACFTTARRPPHEDEPKSDDRDEDDAYR